MGASEQSNFLQRQLKAVKANVSAYWIELALPFITWTQKFQGISSYSVSHGGGGLVAKSFPTKVR